MPEHAPSPSPSRAVYGFVLYLGSCSALGLYMMWAVTPDSVLHSLGLTYWPQKYWAVTLPIFGCVLLAVFAFFIYPGLNFILVPPVDDLRNITDSYSTPLDESLITEVPPASDLPLSEVCQTLYLQMCDSTPGKTKCTKKISEEADTLVLNEPAIKCSLLLRGHKCV